MLFDNQKNVFISSLFFGLGDPQTLNCSVFIICALCTKFLFPYASLFSPFLHILAFNNWLEWSMKLEHSWKHKECMDNLTQEVRVTYAMHREGIE